MIISSTENKKVKEVVKLKSKKYRDITNTFVIETENLVNEAKKIGIVKDIFLVEDESNSSDNYNFVTKEVMKKMSSLETPSKILAVCEKIDSKKIIGKKLLLLDEIQDPGNLGTIIRSSVAFGVDTIVLSPNTVDLYNPKVIRASEGMFCHLNIVVMDLKEAIDIIKTKNIAVYGTDVVNGKLVSSIANKESYALVMGNEGKGLSTEIKSMCDSNLYIPMKQVCESLNVGVACSILLYELEK